MIVCGLSMGISCSVVRAFSYAGLVNVPPIVDLRRAAVPSSFCAPQTTRQLIRRITAWTVCYRTNRKGKARGDFSRFLLTASHQVLLPPREGCSATGCLFLSSCI